MGFQETNPTVANQFEINRNAHITFFVEHTHRSFEYFGQIRGETEVTIDGKKLLLHPGDAVLIFPFQAHSYSSKAPTDAEICIFSSDMVPDFFANINGLIPTDNTFKFQIPPDFKTDNLSLCHAISYTICGEFEAQNPEREYITSSADDVLTTLLVYVENNFSNECSLNTAAKELGYDYSYLSKQFKKKIGMSFNRYVNLLRIRKSQNYIRTSKMNFSEIMMLCGFTSLRSFDRNFRYFTKMSPSEYKKLFSSQESKNNKLKV